MGLVRTVLSLDERLLARADRWAAKLNVPRSRVVARALEQFLDRHDAQSLLEEINIARDDGLEPSQTQWLKAMAARQRKLAGKPW
jgi:predicted transcriptional regulator